MAKNPERVITCKLCGRTYPRSDEFFQPHFTKKKNCISYLHICRRCSWKYRYKDRLEKSRKKKEAREKRDLELYWKNRSAVDLVAGVPEDKLEEYLVTLYALVGLDFYEEMEKKK